MACDKPYCHGGILKRLSLSMPLAFSPALCQWVKWLNGNRRDSYEEITIPAIQYSLQDVLTFSEHSPPLLSISPISISGTHSS